MYLLRARRPRLAILPALLACLLLTATPASISAQSAAAALRPVAQADRLPVHPDFAPLSQLGGHVPTWAQAGRQSAAHPVDLSSRVHASFILRRDPAVQAAFDQLLTAQQTPGSPLYHQWLTPQQVGSLFGPTAHDLAVLTAWLTSQGLTVELISPSGVILHVSGTAAVLGNALHTSFGIFNPDAGSSAQPRLSITSEPSLPSALLPLVRSIRGLSEIPLTPLNHARAVQGKLQKSAAASTRTTSPLLTLSSGDHFMSPGDFAIIYDLNSVYNGGNKGATIGSKAQHIAIVGESRVAATDLSEFEAATGLPSVQPNVIIPNGSIDPGTTGTSAQDEATLDVTRVIATAPGATVDLVVAQDTATEDGIFFAAQYNVDTLLDPIMSISFGGCEADALANGVDYVDSFASAGAAEGITTLVSSGDSGAAGCDTSFKPTPLNQVASINFICSSSYVTCVGGTEFNDAVSSTYWSSDNSASLVSVLSYIPEGAWNEPSSVANGVTSYVAAATGGGASQFITKPAWQTGTGVPADGFRDVPDVSFSAASHDGYYACLAYAGGDCNNGYFEDFSGTSATAPAMAGVVALLNQAQGSAQGNINPLLYSTAKSTPSAFHDATVTTSGITGCSTATPSICNNSTPGPTTLTGGLAGYELTTGFDLATGLGSLDVASFLNAAGGASSSGSFTLTSTPTTLSITPTGTAFTTGTTTIQAASAGGFTGAVALTCAVTPVTAIPPTCALSSTSLTLAADGTGSSTLTITTQAAFSGCNTASNAPPSHFRSTGIILAGLLLLLIPNRRRRQIKALALLFAIGASLASLNGCSSSSSSSPPCTALARAGTTAGTYTVTVTGTSGSVTQSTSVALTVNAQTN